MGLFKGGSAPKPPDPWETAAAEAEVNRVNTYGPDGSGMRYGYVGNDGQFISGTPAKGQQAAVSYVESPTQEAIRLMLEPAGQQFVNRMIQDNVTNMPSRPGVVAIPGRGHIADSIFQRQYQTALPAMRESQETLLTNLQARGMPVGGEGFNDAYNAQLRETQETIGRMALDSDIAASQEQSRLFGLGMNQFDMAQNLRNSAIAEIAAAMGGAYQPASNAPSGNVPSIDIGGHINSNYQSQLAAHQQQQQQAMGMAGALGNAAMGLMKSSVFAKEIHAVVEPSGAAQVIRDTETYLWAYRDGEGRGGERRPHIGPMAQDLHARTGFGLPDALDPIDMNGLLFAALKHALERIEILERQISPRPERMI